MTSSVQFLNEEYQDHFLKNRGQVKDQFKLLEKYLVENKCTFKGEVMPTLLKPNFISQRQSALLKDSVERMSRALTKFITLYLSEDRVKKIMNFSEKENDLFSIDPGYGNPLVVSRLDAFMNGESLKFLEFNCDSPAGIAYSDIQDEGFRELLGMYPFLEKYNIEYINRQHILLSSLLDCYAEFRTTHQQLPEIPVVAIVDWAGVSTYSEFELHQQYFRDHGIETIITTPQDFSIRNGKALADGQEVHLIYKRIITRELVARWEQVGVFVEAIREGLVCCCNSFRSIIVGNKKVLSVITDQRFNSIFTAAEKQLIKETIPWTRVLADSTVNFYGKEVELKSFVPEHKDLLVLKPSNKYGGKDVHIGNETPQSTWEEIMNKHIEDGIWVVQEFVDIPTDLYPEISDSVKFKSKYVNINPFALNGNYSGTITRVSDSQVINVSAGGGLVPTLTASRVTTDPD
ncbi:MAG: glutathionylspermidine synthase family protein [Bacteroidales bacterium]|nr:glutathionylspermidine synthase family protein [Bacteroidales bacterium]